jgi:hypothetical protein
LWLHSFLGTSRGFLSDFLTDFNRLSSLNIFGKLGGKFSKATHGTSNQIVNYLAKVRQGVTSKAQSSNNGFLKTLSRVASPNIMAKLQGNLSNAGTRTSNTLLNYLAKIRQGVTSKSKSSNNGFLKTLNRVASPNIMAKLQGNLSKAGTRTSNTLFNYINHIKKGVQNVGSRAGHQTSDTFVKYLSTFRKGIKSLKWSKLKNTIEDFRDDVRDGKPELQGYLREVYGPNAFNKHSKQTNGNSRPNNLLENVASKLSANINRQTTGVNSLGVSFIKKNPFHNDL